MKVFSAFLLLLFASLFSFSQSNQEILQKLESISDSSSSIQNSLVYLSDVYGPRMMGTPKYYNSVLWAEKELKKWGVANVRLQSFDENYVGWELEGFSMEFSKPHYAPLSAYPLAFSKSSKGSQEGEPLLVNSFREVYGLKGKLRGKIIMLKGYYRQVGNVQRPMSSRLDEHTLARAASNPDPNEVIIGYHSRRSTKDVFEYRARVKKVRTDFLSFCEKEGVVAVVEPSNFPYGILHADGNRTVPSFNKIGDLKPLPSFVMSNEHFGRIIRMMDLGITPKIKLRLETKFYEVPAYNVNLIAEIEGTDDKLKDELVIIGGHLDSWHAGTGAVDNASNCVVLMEALRLIKKSGLKPRRTIRMVLWGGEEQVFSGSRKYVGEYVGDFENGMYKSENEKIAAYLNLDNGAGMIRGIYLNGNEAIEPFFARYLQPFEKSKTLTLQNANQTDHELFDYFNVPAFQFIQDPLDYMTAIHHTNMDVYEYVPLNDQKYNAKLVAYLAFQIAQEDGQLPRKKFNSPIPSQKGNTTFELEGYKDAKKVSLVGDFNNWNMFGTLLYKTERGWECKIDLPKGKYLYKFIVDGYWTANPRTAQKDLLKDGKGHGGLTAKIVD
ncbi:MAG: M20/M25/M40 family metallo-hydrolase [Bacteroidia bacterium]|nr:M20/M25/M40 family metallo-hydrolase [Bacteroidia bacterium]